MQYISLHILIFVNKLNFTVNTSVRHFCLNNTSAKRRNIDIPPVTNVSAVTGSRKISKAASGGYISSGLGSRSTITGPRDVQNKNSCNFS